MTINASEAYIQKNLDLIVKGRNLLLNTIIGKQNVPVLSSFKGVESLNEFMTISPKNH